MKFLSTFKISKGFDRWVYLVDVELKPLLEKYKLTVHFASTNDDETRVYDLSEAQDPSCLNFSRTAKLLGFELRLALSLQATRHYLQ